jgi:tetratricopeptide (TPR) repeat protein
MIRHLWVGVIVLFLTTAVLLSPAARADYKQAVAYYNQGKFTQAIAALKDDVSKNADWEFGQRLMGLCYLKLNNPAMAQSFLSRAADLKSPAYATYFGLGQAYFSLKKYDNCISSLEKAEPLAEKEDRPDKQKADVYALRGKAYYEMKKYNEAVNDLIKALRVNQSDWVSYNILGDSYFRLSRFDEAVQALEKAHSMKSDNSAIADTLGKIYRKQGTDALAGKQYDLAIRTLSKAKEYSPKDGYVYYNLAEAYLFQKNYPEAEKALGQALSLVPKDSIVDVYGRLGLAYENQKKWDLALDTYKKADGVSPNTKWVKEAIERVNANKKK